MRAAPADVDPRYAAAWQVGTVLAEFKYAVKDSAVVDTDDATSFLSERLDQREFRLLERLGLRPYDRHYTLLVSAIKTIRRTVPRYSRPTHRVHRRHVRRTRRSRASRARGSRGDPSGDDGEPSELDAAPLLGTRR